MLYHIWTDSTLTFLQHIPVHFGVEIESHKFRKVSQSIEDSGLHNETAPRDSNPIFIVLLYCNLHQGEVLIVK